MKLPEEVKTKLCFDPHMIDLEAIVRDCAKVCWSKRKEVCASQFAHHDAYNQGLWDGQQAILSRYDIEPDTEKVYIGGKMGVSE